MWYELWSTKWADSSLNHGGVVPLDKGNGMSVDWMCRGQCTQKIMNILINQTATMPRMAMKAENKNIWLIEVKTNRWQKQKQRLIDYLKQVSIENVDAYNSTTRMRTGRKREQNCERKRNRWAIECVCDGNDDTTKMKKRQNNKMTKTTWQQSWLVEHDQLHNGNKSDVSARLKNRKQIDMMESFLVFVLTAWQWIQATTSCCAPEEEQRTTKSSLHSADTHQNLQEVQEVQSGFA